MVGASTSATSLRSARRDDRTRNHQRSALGKHCRQIRTRAQDLPDGRVSIIEAARALVPLATRTRAGNTPAFQIFHAIDGETCFLPVDEVRNYWAPEALAREDITIRAAEERWRPQAIATATALVQQYAWGARKTPHARTWSKATRIAPAHLLSATPPFWGFRTEDPCTSLIEAAPTPHT